MAVRYRYLISLVDYDGKTIERSYTDLKSIKQDLGLPYNTVVKYACGGSGFLATSRQLKVTRTRLTD